MENDLQPLVIYKNNQEITSTQQLPVEHKNRICTDLFCTVFSSIFALVMLVMAIINFDLQKLKLTTYPTDIDGRLCTMDANFHNYLYFTSPTDPKKRLCVAQCPAGNQTSLRCLPSNNLSCHENFNPQFQVIIYPSVASDTSMGLFCMPLNPKLKQTILLNSRLKEKFLFDNAYRAILYSILSSIALGFMFLLLVYFIPATVTYVAIVVGGIGCIGVGIMLFIVNSELLRIYNAIKITFSVLIIVIGILCLLSLIFYSKDIKICILYLKFSGEFLRKALPLLVFIFVFYVLMAGLIGLMLFQMFAYWSHGNVSFYPQKVYKTLGDTFSTIMLIICGVEFFWGMAFLKESFNFLISGNAVYFNFKKKLSISFALGNLFKFHWGSVVAGSFLLDFFYIFDVFYDFMKPKDDKNLEKFSKICCCCDRILGLARSDTFSFLNIVGHPYCNSARYCEQIDDRSESFEGSQSVFRFFRMGSHVMLASISTLISYLIMKGQCDEVSVLGLMVSFIISIFLVTFSISLMAQIGESLSLCDLVQSYIKNENQLPSRVQRVRNNKDSIRSSDNKNRLNSSQVGYTIHQTTN